MEFDSSLFRMSAIAKTQYPENMFTWEGYQGEQYDPENETFYIYTKGSPESMYHIFDKKSLPETYHQTIKEYASQGLRVLAIGHRKINPK